MILTTYNKKLHEKTLRREGRDEGIQNINRLNGYLLADKRYRVSGKTPERIWNRVK